MLVDIEVLCKILLIKNNQVSFKVLYTKKNISYTLLLINNYDIHELISVLEELKPSMATE